MNDTFDKVFDGVMFAGLWLLLVGGIAVACGAPQWVVYPGVAVGAFFILSITVFPIALCLLLFLFSPLIMLVVSLSNLLRRNPEDS